MNGSSGFGSAGDPEVADLRVLAADPVALVTTLHPHHDWSRGHTVAAGQQVGELLRYLVHATGEATAVHAIPTPIAAAELIRALHLGMARLPDLFTQVAARQRSLADHPALAADPHQRVAHPGRPTTATGPVGPQEIAAGAADALDAAADAVNAMTRQLAAARELAERLYLRPQDRPPEEIADR